MWTSAQILQHIDQLASDAVFTTRDLLTYGKRGAVDQTLYRMVKCGLIIRLARGVFIKNVIGQREVSLREVAETKAAAFGKKLMTHAHDCAIKLGLIDEPNQLVMFNVSGHSSSFKCGDVQIILQGVSARRFVLRDSQHGMLMRAFWYMERMNFKRPDYWLSIGSLSSSEHFKLLKRARWIPSWLSDRICRS